MKRAIYYHIYNLFKFSSSGDYENTIKKSKETFSSHLNNLIVIFIIFPLWIILDGNSFVKEHVSSDKYELKNFTILIILLITLLGFTKINFIKSYIDKFYTEDLVNKSIEISKDVQNNQNTGYTNGKNTAIASGKIAGAWAGAKAGAVISGVIGSVIPVIGTGAGALVGGLVGAAYLGIKGSDAGGAIVEEIYK